MNTNTSAAVLASLLAVSVNADAATAPIKGMSADEQKPVTLAKPYPLSFKGASSDKLAVQYAVLELGKQVGLTYELRGKEIVLKKLIVEGEGWRGFRLGAKRGRRHLRSKELTRTPP